MNERRERQDTYYLQKIHDPVLLYADGSVGELVRRNVNVKVKMPGRVEGRERVGTIVQPRLAEVALHDCLSDYLVNKRGKAQAVATNHRGDWSLKDMPEETLAAYEDWKNNTEQMNLDDVRELAATKVSSQEDRLTQAMPCQSCYNSDRKYACYSCGYAREIYVYPLARYHGDGETYDVPIDVADIIRLDPTTLGYKTEWEADHNGLMSATKSIVFDAHTIPKEYVTGVKSDEMLTIDPVDDLSRNVEFVVDKWAEDEKVKSNQNNRMLRREEVLESYDPASYLQALQNRVAVHSYGEIKDGKDYNALLTGLHKELGKRGLELAYEVKYMGMGDSEGRFYQVNRVGKHITMKALGGSFNVELALEDTIKQLAE